MSETTSWIEAIRLRPELFLGCKSLTALYHFYQGYRTACGDHGVEDDRFGLRIPDDFHCWVAYRTQFRESTSGWCNMIVHTSASEEEAFDRFFELLEEHSRRVPRVVVEIIGPASTRRRLGHEEVIPAPERVQLVTYTDDPGFFVLHGSPHFRDCFHPFLSWMHGLSGGEWVIHDESAYQQMLREDAAWQRERQGVGE